jgi:hypothetical protein
MVPESVKGTHAPCAASTSSATVVTKSGSRANPDNRTIRIPSLLAKLSGTTKQRQSVPDGP